MKPPSRGRKRGRAAATPEPGLHLVIAERGEVVRSAPISHATRRPLQPPFLVARNLAAARGDRKGHARKELVLETLDAKGTVLESFGWNWIADAFHDVAPSRRRAASAIGRVPTLTTLRVLRLPLARDAAFLLLSQTNLGPDEDSRLFQTGLHLYALTPDRARRRPPLPRHGVRLKMELLPGPVELRLPRPE